MRQRERRHSRLVAAASADCLSKAGAVRHAAARLRGLLAVSVVSPVSDFPLHTQMPYQGWEGFWWIEKSARGECGGGKKGKSTHHPAHPDPRRGLPAFFSFWGSEKGCFGHSALSLYLLPQPPLPEV